MKGGHGSPKRVKISTRVHWGAFNQASHEPNQDHIMPYRLNVHHSQLCDTASLYPPPMQRRIIVTLHVNAYGMMS